VRSGLACGVGVMFALLYGGSLCVIGGLALVAVAWALRAQREKHQSQLETLDTLVDRIREDRAAEIDSWRDRYKRLAARCKELERELTEIKLGTATAGYTFGQVPARTIPARVRMVKAR
jgi:hypothetical protein